MVAQMQYSSCCLLLSSASAVEWFVSVWAGIEAVAMLPLLQVTEVVLQQYAAKVVEHQHDHRGHLCIGRLVVERTQRSQLMAMAVVARMVKPWHSHSMIPVAAVADQLPG